MNNIRLLKTIVVYFIIISSTSLYTLRIFPESFRNLMLLGGIGIMVFILILDLKPDSSARLHKHFTPEVSLFLLATFGSMFIAKAYHQQNFETTLLVQRFMYFYLFYFVLHSLKLDAQIIEKIILPLGLLYAFFYIFQYISFPVKYFDSRVELSRGTVRIFMPGVAFMTLAFFQSMQAFFTTNKIKYLILVLLFFLVGGILSGTRQSLAGLTLISAAFIFFNKQVKSRLLIVFLAALAGAAIIAIFYDIFIEMVTLTQKETTSARPNVRILAAKFFLTDFMPAKIAYILGNGQDSLNSVFGQRVNLYKLVRGYYQSDVGIIGEYSKFGVLFVIAQLSVMIRIIFGKLHPRISYFRYFFAAMALVMFSGSNLFGYADGIAFVCMVLYIIDYYRNFPQRDDKNQVSPVREP